MYRFNSIANNLQQEHYVKFKYNPCIGSIATEKASYQNAM